MISDAAFNAIQSEIQRRGLTEGVLGEALSLYQANHSDLRSSDPSLNARELERTLLVQTSINSLVSVADKNFLNNARKAVKPDQIKNSLSSFGWNILIGLITNFLFLIIMISIYLTSQDTAQSLFKSLGVNLVTDPNSKTAVLPAQSPSATNVGSSSATVK
ncbi:hypothetical protein [Asticcacaulis sp. MM231]|uniref:hypothetical protein n=1 Tax=Asticcacaulis sp. MM231 TaxID=3157666 RepID=UPI0032D577A5